MTGVRMPLQPGPVGLITGPHIAKIADKLPSNKLRASMVDSLLRAFELDLPCETIPVKLITRGQLLEYHDLKFVDFLLQDRENKPGKRGSYRPEPVDPNASVGSIEFNTEDEEDQVVDDNDEYLSDDEFISGNYEDDDDEDEEEITKLKPTILKKQAFGLEYDCPLFAQLDQYVRTIAGATVACAQYLITKGKAWQTITPEMVQTQAPIAINWHGGRHHGKKSKSAGFCYVNDVVLGILELRKVYDKVIYIDLDLHHGDGVATAFTYSNKVLCLSIHRYDVGFYPGTGRVSDGGIGRGKNFTVNVPLLQGLKDDTLDDIFTRVIQPYYDAFKPDAVVVLCGCDGLTRDPHKEWNLSIRGLGDSVDKILQWNKPTMLLGGGGYHHRDTARCWSYLTAKALKWTNMDEEWDLLPEHPYLDDYKEDGYTFWVDEMAGNMTNANTPEYINEVVQPLQDRLKEIKR